MKLRLTAVATVATALTVPATASAATLEIVPDQRCYGSGQTVKAANQLIVAANIQALSEAVIFLEAYGVDTKAAGEFRGENRRPPGQLIGTRRGRAG